MGGLLGGAVGAADSAEESESKEGNGLDLCSRKRHSPPVYSETVT